MSDGHLLHIVANIGMEHSGMALRSALHIGISVLDVGGQAQRRVGLVIAVLLASAEALTLPGGAVHEMSAPAEV